MRRFALPLGIILGVANFIAADPWLYIDTGAGRERYSRMPTAYIAGESVVIGVLVWVAAIGATRLIDKLHRTR